MSCADLTANVSQIDRCLFIPNARLLVGKHHLPVRILQPRGNEPHRLSCRKQRLVGQDGRSRNILRSADFCLGPAVRAAGPSVKSEAKCEFPERRFVTLPIFSCLIPSHLHHLRHGHLSGYYSSGQVHNKIHALSCPGLCWQMSSIYIVDIR